MSTRAFSSADVTRLLGMSPIYLNALVHRGLYGIVASISERSEGKARIFDEEDVIGIGLVWTLFQSGLRTQQIRAILKKLGKTREADAKHTTNKLSGLRSADCLLVIREPQKTKGKEMWSESVEIVDQHELSGIMDVYKAASVLVIPIGERLNDLKLRIAALFKEK